MIPDEIFHSIQLLADSLHWARYGNEEDELHAAAVRQWLDAQPQVPQPDWEPLEDDEVVTGDFWPTVITVREGNRVDVSSMGFVLPDDIRLCRRIGD